MEAQPKVSGTPPESPSLLENREVIENIFAEVEKADPVVAALFNSVSNDDVFTKLVVAAGVISDNQIILCAESWNTIGKELIKRAKILAEGEGDYFREFARTLNEETFGNIQSNEVRKFFSDFCNEITREDYTDFILNCGKVAMMMNTNGYFGVSIITGCIERLHYAKPEQFDTLFKPSFLAKISRNLIMLESFCDKIMKQLFKKEWLSQYSFDAVSETIVNCCKMDDNEHFNNSIVISKFLMGLEPNEHSRNFVENTLIPSLRKANCDKSKNSCILLLDLLGKDLISEGLRKEAFDLTLDMIKEQDEKGGIKPGVMNMVAEKAFVVFMSITHRKNLLSRDAILSITRKICSDVTSGALKHLIFCHYKCLDQLMLSLGPDEDEKQILIESHMFDYVLNETLSYVRNYGEEFGKTNLSDLRESDFLYGYGPFNKELEVRLLLIHNIAKTIIGIEEDREEDKLFLYNIWDKCFVNGFCVWERALIRSWIVSLFKDHFDGTKISDLLKPSLNKIKGSIQTIPPKLIPESIDIFKIVFWMENKDFVLINTIEVSPKISLYKNADFRNLKMVNVLWSALATPGQYFQKLEVLAMLYGIFDRDESKLLEEYANKIKELSRDEEHTEKHQDEIVSLIKLYDEYFITSRLKVKRKSKIFSNNRNSIIEHYSSVSDFNDIDINCTFKNTGKKFILKYVNPYLTSVYSLQEGITSILGMSYENVREKYDMDQLRFKIVPQGTTFSVVDYHDAGFAFLSEPQIGITSNVDIEVSAIDKMILEDDKSGKDNSCNEKRLERLGDSVYPGKRKTIIEHEEVLKVPRKLAIILCNKSAWHGTTTAKASLQFKDQYSREAMTLEDGDVIFEEDSIEEITKIINDNEIIAKMGGVPNKHKNKPSQFIKKSKQIVEIESEETLKERLNPFTDSYREAKCARMTEILIGLLDSQCINVGSAALQSLSFVTIPKYIYEPISKDEKTLIQWMNNYFSNSFAPSKGVYGLCILRYVLSTDATGKLMSVLEKQEGKAILEEYINIIGSIMQSYESEGMICEEEAQKQIREKRGSLLINILSTALWRSYYSENMLGMFREIFVSISCNDIYNSVDSKYFGIMVLLATIKFCKTVEDVREISSNNLFIKNGLKCPETANLCAKLIDNICGIVSSSEVNDTGAKIEIMGGIVSDMFKWMDSLNTQKFYDSLVASLGSLMKLIPEEERIKYSYYPETILKAAVAIAEGTYTNTSIEHTTGIFKLFGSTLKYYRNLFNSIPETHELLKNFAVIAYKKYISLENASEFRNAVMPVVEDIIGSDIEIAQKIYNEALPDIMNGIKASSFVSNNNYWDYYPGYEEKVYDDVSSFFDDNNRIKYPGLINMGNTCYMNSVLQQMFHITPLRKAIANIDISKISPDKLKPVENLKKLFEKMTKNEKRTEALREFASSVNSKDFDVHRQQDADEFFGLIYDKLEEALKNTPHWEEISHIFNGKSLNILTSPSGKITRVPDNFRNITLNVSKTLYTGFDELIKPEELDSKSIKRTALQELPPVLVIQLKRFDYSNNTKDYTKNNGPVQLFETLDMSKYIQECDIDPALRKAYSQYKLRGVILHQGERATCGHYFSYIKADNINEKSDNDMEVDQGCSTANNEDRTWMGFNDDTVSILSNQTIDHLLKEGHVNEYGNPSGYILFYERELLPSVDDVIIPYCKVVKKQKKEDKPQVPVAQTSDMCENETKKISHVVFAKEHLHFVLNLFEAISPAMKTNNDIKEVLLEYFMNIVIRSDLKNEIGEWNNLISDNILSSKDGAERLISYLIQKDFTISVLGKESSIKAAVEFERLLLHAISVLVEDEEEALKNISIIDGQSQEEVPLIIELFKSIINGIKLVNNLSFIINNY